MAKRKPVDKVEIDAASRLVKTQAPPLCYNTKCQYCREDLCGDWFSTCKVGVDEATPLALQVG